MKKDIDFLIDFQEKLKAQDSEGPIFWSIMDYDWKVVTEEDAERVTVFLMDSCTRVRLDEYADRDYYSVNKIDIEDNEFEDIKYYIEEGNYDELLDLIETVEGGDCYFIFEEEHTSLAYNAFFLTEDEAEKHLRENRHHYSNKAHTYAMPVWRSPGMERLIDVLKNTDWSSLQIK